MALHPVSAYRPGISSEKDDFVFVSATGDLTATVPTTARRVFAKRSSGDTATLTFPKAQDMQGIILTVKASDYTSAKKLVGKFPGYGADVSVDIAAAASATKVFYSDGYQWHTLA